MLMMETLYNLANYYIVNCPLKLKDTVLCHDILNTFDISVHLSNNTKKAFLVQ